MIIHINIRLYIYLESFEIQIVFQAMHCLLWHSFKIWNQSKDKSVNYPTIVSDIQKIRKKFNRNEFQKLLSSEKFPVFTRSTKRILITAHSRAAFIDKCSYMTAAKCTPSHIPKELVLSRMKGDEDVERVKEVITNWHNPF